MTEQSPFKIEGKIFIEGQIELLTGLHIGAGKDTMEIGGLDLAVIKRQRTDGKLGTLNVPYIPGSSIKGKLRSMLARVEGSKKVDEDYDFYPYICEIFGHPGRNINKEEKDVQKELIKLRDASENPHLFNMRAEAYITRLTVRDADLDLEAFKADLPDFEGESPLTDSKFENTIDRPSGTAKHPRQLERVPAGARFDFQLVYDSYNDGKTDSHLRHIIKAMNLLADDYIGGSGTRGYGRIKFNGVTITQKTIADYEQNRAASKYEAVQFNPTEAATA